MQLICFIHAKNNDEMCITSITYKNGHNLKKIFCFYKTYASRIMSTQTKSNGYFTLLKIKKKLYKIIFNVYYECSII